MGELQKLPNIAEKLEAQLIEVGVPTIDALMTTGSREAWLRIAAIDPSACVAADASDSVASVVSVAA